MCLVFEQKSIVCMEGEGAIQKESREKVQGSGDRVVIRADGNRL